MIVGRHYTHNNALKSADIEAKKHDVKMMEEDKTKCIGQGNIEKYALAIIESELPIDAITNTHFTKLLLWYRVKKSEMGNKPQMKQKYNTMRESSEDAPVVYS